MTAAPPSPTAAAWGEQGGGIPGVGKTLTTLHRHIPLDHVLSLYRHNRESCRSYRDVTVTETVLVSFTPLEFRA